MAGQQSEIMKHYYVDIRQYTVLTREQEVELAREARDGSAPAMERLIECNLRFVVKIAAEYQYYGVPIEDLISEGNLGLMAAAHRFDPERGTRFISWAVAWIRKSIYKALNEQHTVRIPESQLRKMRQARDTGRRLAEEFGREPTLTEIAERLEENVGEVEPLHLHGIRLSSLDDPAGDNDGGTLAARLEGERITVEEQMIHSEAIERVEVSCDKLEDTERAVIRGRFGLDDRPQQTLCELAREIGRSREGVRVIERRAIRRLGKRLTAEGYRVPGADRGRAIRSACV